ncbi:Uncharacterised protein [Vibrio cholerae]|nr:Uncharacterised protein [Vibrio cholerae]
MVQIFLPKRETLGQRKPQAHCRKSRRVLSLKSG